MDNLGQILIQQWQMQSNWEVLAVLLSVAYVVLAARGSIWCWPCALLSTAIFSWLFFDVNLVQESALNLYYLLMAVYGWWQWNNHDVTLSKQGAPVQSWAWQKHVIAIIVMTGVSLLSGYLSVTYLNADLPYLDAFTTWFAVFTTYLVAKKVLENWLYWLAINPLAMLMYWQKDFYLTSALMLIYIAMSIYGYWQWRKLYLIQLKRSDEHSSKLSLAN